MTVVRRKSIACEVKQQRKCLSEVPFSSLHMRFWHFLAIFLLVLTPPHRSSSYLKNATIYTLLTVCIEFRSTVMCARNAAVRRSSYLNPGKRASKSERNLTQKFASIVVSCTAFNELSVNRQQYGTARMGMHSWIKEMQSKEKNSFWHHGIAWMPTMELAGGWFVSMLSRD